MERTVARYPLSVLRGTIQDERRYVGRREFSHNIVTQALSMIDEWYGREAANQAIRDLKLEELGWPIRAVMRLN